MRSPISILTSLRPPLLPRHQLVLALHELRSPRRARRRLMRIDCDKPRAAERDMHGDPPRSAPMSTTMLPVARPRAVRRRFAAASAPRSGRPGGRPPTGRPPSTRASRPRSAADGTHKPPLACGCRAFCGPSDESAAASVPLLEIRDHAVPSRLSPGSCRAWVGEHALGPSIPRRAPRRYAIHAPPRTDDSDRTDASPTHVYDSCSPCRGLTACRRPPLRR